MKAGKREYETGVSTRTSPFYTWS